MLVHVFQVGVSVNIQADFGDNTKVFTFNLIKHSPLRKIKNFIFKDKVVFILVEIMKNIVFLC